LGKRTVKRKRKKKEGSAGKGGKRTERTPGESLNASTDKCQR